MAVAVNNKNGKQHNKQTAVESPQPTPRQQELMVQFFTQLLDKQKVPSETDLTLLRGFIKTLELKGYVAEIATFSPYELVTTTRTKYPVRFWAALGLGKVGSDIRATLALIQVFRDATKEENGDEADDDERTSEATAYALAHLLSADIALQPLLDTLTNDPDSDVRQWCAITLGQVDDKRPVVIEQLKKAARYDSEEAVRLSASDSLEALGHHGEVAQV